MADDGRVIDLSCADEAAWAGVWRARTGDRLRCRACGRPLHAKLRAATGLRFFAHTVAVPECPSQGETARHLALKAPHDPRPAGTTCSPFPMTPSERSPWQCSSL